MEVVSSGSIWDVVLPSLDVMDIMDMRPGGKRGIKKYLMICEQKISLIGSKNAKDLASGHLFLHFFIPFFVER